MAPGSLLALLFLGRVLGACTLTLAGLYADNELPIGNSVPSPPATIKNVKKR